MRVIYSLYVTIGSFIKISEEPIVRFIAKYDGIFETFTWQVPRSYSRSVTLYLLRISCCCTTV